MGYKIRIEPPKEDGYWGCITLKNKNTDGSHEIQPKSREKALEKIYSVIEYWTEKSEDKFWSRPTKRNIELKPHPDYENEITMTQVFGTQTLDSFGAGNGSRYSEKEWYETRAEYQKYFERLERDEALYFFHRPLSCFVEEWIRKTKEGYESLQHNIRFNRWNREKVENISKKIRRLSGAGLIESEPIFKKKVDVGVTPYLSEYDYIPNWPAEVEGWHYCPDHKDGWISGDGKYKVSVVSRPGSANVSVRPIRGDLRYSYNPSESPDDCEDSELSKAEARDIAVDWMKDNPAKLFSHPDVEDRWGSRWCWNCLSVQNLETNIGGSCSNCKNNPKDKSKQRELAKKYEYKKEPVFCDRNFVVGGRIKV